MELSVKGLGKELKQEQPFLSGRRSEYDSKGLGLKHSLLNINDRSQPAKNIAQAILDSNRKEKSQRKLTRDDLDAPQVPVLRKPNLRSDISFTSSRNYIAFSSPKHINIGDVEEKLDKKHKEMCLNEIQNASYQILSKSKNYIEKIFDWNREKVHRYEESLRKYITPNKFTNLSPGSPEDYNSDEEDFTYSFTNSVGKIRKKYHKLIDVSRRPDYIGSSNYVSMQPYVKYTPKIYTPKVSKYTIVKEANFLKSFFAKKDIRSKFEDISGTLMDLTSSALPRGGEGLLKRS